MIGDIIFTVFFVSALVFIDLLVIRTIIHDMRHDPLIRSDRQLVALGWLVIAVGVITHIIVGMSINNVFST